MMSCPLLPPACAPCRRPDALIQRRPPFFALVLAVACWSIACEINRNRSDMQVRSLWMCREVQFECLFDQRRRRSLYCDNTVHISDSGMISEKGCGPCRSLAGCACAVVMCVDGSLQCLVGWQDGGCAGRDFVSSRSIGFNAECTNQNFHHRRGAVCLLSSYALK